MKTSIFAKFSGVVALTLLITYSSAQVKIGDNPSVTNSSAVLELEKTNKGLLITRVSLASVTDVTTIPSPADGLLVYNTNFGGGGNPVSPGFYYWRQDQGRWIRLLTTLNGSVGDVWIDGNNNILSANSASQSLRGKYNIILGELAFEDWNDTTDSYIAIGHEAGKEDETDGYADVIAIGNQAAFSNSGANLIALGWKAAYDNTGQFVNALGRAAASFNLGGSVNALGLQAAQHNTGGSVNALGENAAQFNNNNEVNAFGTEAAAVNQGGDVVAMGSYTLHNNTGHLVNGIGPMAGMDNSGWSVNALGSESGKNNTGSELNAFGAMSAQYNTAAAVNALGRQAAMYNTGYGTNAFGDEAAKFNNGAHAVAIGEQTLLGAEFGDPEGEGNIGIGYQAGISVGTGQRNICLGFQADIPNPSANDQINIGNNIIRQANGIIELKDLIQLTPTTEPASPADGMIYFDSTAGKLRGYGDGSWHDLW